MPERNPAPGDVRRGRAQSQRVSIYGSVSLFKASQCLACGTLVSARMREQAASDSPVASAISLSENASSFGATSRLNHASSRGPGCSRAQLRLRRCPSLIASPRTRFTAALRRGSLPAAACAASALRAASIARTPCSRRALGMHASQCRRRRLSTGPPHAAHGDRRARAALRPRRTPRLAVAYGRGCEGLRGVAEQRRSTRTGVALRRRFRWWQRADDVLRRRPRAASRGTLARGARRPAPSAAASVEA